MCTIEAARRLINTKLTTYRNWSGQIPNYFTGKLNAPRDPMISVDAVALEMVMEDYAKLQAKFQCSLGVGDGSGKLFVHGDYDSIKAAQKLVENAERLMGLRGLCGYVEDGSSQSVTLFQDDATKDWFCTVAHQRDYHGTSFIAAIDAARNSMEGV